MCCVTNFNGSDTVSDTKKSQSAESCTDSQFLSQLLLVKSDDHGVPDLRNRRRHDVHLPQLIERRWISSDVPVVEFDPMLRKKLFR